MFLKILILPNFDLEKLTVAKSGCVKLFLWIFVFVKKSFHKILIFFILAEVFLWAGNPRSCAGAFFGKEGKE
jgi:hypothetical protein